MAVSERADTVESGESPRQPILAEVGPISLAVCILALCAFFHFWRLDATPGWDPQEGYNLDIAWNLLHGHPRIFALPTAFAQHPPLFYLQLALAIRVFGYSVIAVRVLAGVYALLTCVAIIFVGRRILGWGPALWAAAVFTVAPLMLDNTRWGYSYAQLTFLGVLVLYAAWCHFEMPTLQWLVAASALAGLAAFSDYVGVAWVLFVALLALRRGWRSGALAAGVGAGVLLLGLLVCFLTAPGAFLTEITSTAGRAAGGNLLTQFIELLVNYYRLFSFDPWIVLGVVGLALIPHSRPRAFLLGATAALALVTLKVRVVGPSFHTAMPLLPLLALGAGVAFHRASEQLSQWSRTWFTSATTPASAQAGNGTRVLGITVVSALVVFLAVISPVAIAAASDASGLATTLPTRQDAYLATPSDAKAVANYVLAHAQSGDLVLASPEIAWMFDAPNDAAGHQRILHSADILQALAQSGQAAAFYPANLPQSGWAYRVSLDSARYVIVDNLLRALAAPDQESALIPLLAQVQQWPVAFEQGQYTVYERPGSTNTRVIP